MDDLAPCFKRLGDSFAYDPSLRERVPDVWGVWLREEILTAKVFEEFTDQGAVRIVGFGAWVFVTTEFAARLRRAERPYLRAELVRRWLAHEPVVLTREQACVAHAEGGLTTFFVNDPLSNRELTTEQLQLVESAWGVSLYELRACHLHETFWEVNSARLQRWSEGCGLRLIQDWSEYWRQYGGTPPDDQRPHLVGLTRAEAMSMPGTHAAQLFRHAESRFGFTVRHQELARAALLGLTDEELGDCLHVSLSAIKKRWLAIYDRVHIAMPGWLEHDETGQLGGHRPKADIASAPQSRGREKRRRLLNYLREHPEELHFVNARRD